MESEQVEKAQLADHAWFSDVSEYGPAQGPQNCGNCGYFNEPAKLLGLLGLSGGSCARWANLGVRPDYTCNEWIPPQQEEEGQPEEVQEWMQGFEKPEPMEQTPAEVETKWSPDWMDNYEWFEYLRRLKEEGGE